MVQSGRPSQTGVGNGDGYGLADHKAPAYDSMIQAYTGIMGITGEAGRPPVRCAGSPIDIATAYLAWGTIMTGLRNVAKTGRGMLLEVSLMESALGFMHAYFQGALVGLTLPVRMGSETMGIYPLGAFETGNGEYCLVQVSNEHQWKRFCDRSARGTAGDRSSRATRCESRTATLRPLIQTTWRAPGAGVGKVSPPGDSRRGAERRGCRRAGHRGT